MTAFEVRPKLCVVVSRWSRGSRAPLLALALALPLAACSGRARAKSHVALGEALERKGKIDEAVEAFRRAIDESPDFSVPHRHLGVIMRERGDPRGALESLTRAVSFDPSDAIALAHRGSVLIQLGDPAHAYEDCQGAAKLDPNNQTAQICLCTAGPFANEPKVAREGCERAIQINPQSVPYAVFAAAGKLAEDAEDKNGAIVAYQDLLKVAPEMLDVYPRLARLHIAKGELDDAIALLTRCLGRDPKYGPAHLVLAEIHAGTKHKTLASYHLKSATDAGMVVDLELRATIEALAATPDSGEPTK
ncbi:MAG: tetratricopeptide repeat protein [Deltaproteobacteria bacterium]|nr:tetratricopeptide repeat protein [Deltaproteobacteria bacterium]